MVKFSLVLLFSYRNIFEEFILQHCSLLDNIATNRTMCTILTILNRFGCVCVTFMIWRITVLDILTPAVCFPLLKWLVICSLHISLQMLFFTSKLLPWQPRGRTLRLTHRSNLMRRSLYICGISFQYFGLHRWLFGAGKWPDQNWLMKDPTNILSSCCQRSWDIDCYKGDEEQNTQIHVKDFGVENSGK